MKWIFTILVLSAIIISAQEPIDTDGDGYRNISTLEQLRWVSENDSIDFWKLELDNDIDASDTRNWNISDHDDDYHTPDSAMGWIPIGGFSNIKSVYIKGNGHTIDRLYCNRPLLNYVAFLGNIYTINVEKLRLTNIEINGRTISGGLAGYAFQGIVRNCFTSGIVKSKNDITGGIIGDARAITLLNSYSMTIVKGKNNVGGLIGHSTNAKLINNYFAGKVIAEGEIIEPIACFNKNTDAIINCFWDVNTTNIETSNYGTPKTTKELKNRATYENVSWDLNFNWEIDSSYPFLRKEIPYELQDFDKDGFYEIRNLRDLRFFSESDYGLPLNWELINDIDADSTKYWNGGKGFKPMGSFFLQYNKSFNGNGYQIKNLFINRPEQEDVGFFGYINATILDLGLVDCNITGKSNVGTLVGNNSGMHDNYNHSDMIDTLDGIYRCYATGIVHGDSCTGGFVGKNLSHIQDCYCRTEIYGNKKTAGFVSYNRHSIINCYSASQLYGNDIWGFSADVLKVSTFCYWDSEISNTSQTCMGTPLTTDKMKDISFFKQSGYNFYSIWDIDAEINEGYPFINLQNRTIPIPEPIEPLDPDGNGYLNITNIENLLWMSYKPESLNLKYELINDINAVQTFKWEGYNGFRPIGMNESFTGEFNGNNFKIDSLFINSYPITESTYYALFKETDTYQGSIYNLGVTNCNIRGRYAGAILGSSEGNIFRNNHSSGIIIGDVAGGLVGYHFRNLIEYCYSTASIYGGYSSGGIAGQMNIANISKCYSNGYLLGSGYNGGIVGIVDESNEYRIIENCYSRSKVRGCGILGKNRILIKNCYAAGEIIDYVNKGGLVSFDNNPENSFWDIESSNITTSKGGTGKTTAEMKTKSTFTDAGWDFDTIWFMSEDVNDGYPALFGLDNPPTSVYDIIENEGRLLISPNPSSDFIDVSINQPSEGSEIKIFDVLGNLVISYPVHPLTPALSLREREHRIDISSLPKGVYFVRIGNITEKFVKI